MNWHSFLFLFIWVDQEQSLKKIDPESLKSPGNHQNCVLYKWQYFILFAIRVKIDFLIQIRSLLLWLRFQDEKESAGIFSSFVYVAFACEIHLALLVWTVCFHRYIWNNFLSTSATLTWLRPSQGLLRNSKRGQFYQENKVLFLFTRQDSISESAQI